MEDKSKKLQITFNSEMIKKMEEIASTMGITLNQYILYVLSKDIDNRVNK